MGTRFIDRREELESLQERLASPRLELVVIYGRRRVGKTALILEALHSIGRRDYIYYQAVETGNLRYFKRLAEKVEPRARHAAEDWEAILSFLANHIIVLDEFPYIAEEEPGFLSKLQRLIDHELADTQTKIVLLASSISLTRTQALDYGSPLHGRITGRLHLKPMRYVDTRGFHPSLSWTQLAELYGFAGGIPLYHKRIGDRDLWSWLSQELARRDTWILDEADIVLRSEFRETRIYRGILEAIAYGRVRRKEIADYLGLSSSKLSPYLQRLEETGIIERVWPVTEPPTSKRGRYVLRDYFLAFWHRYVMPNRSLIEEGSYSVWEVRSDYDSYMGLVFEGIARQLVALLNRRGLLPIRYSRAGPWWYKDLEVDLLLLNNSRREAMLLEVKWSRLSIRDQYRILHKLEDAAKHIKAIKDYEKHYGIIAREIEGEGPRELWSLPLSKLDSVVGSAPE